MGDLLSIIFLASHLGGWGVENKEKKKNLHRVALRRHREPQRVKTNFTPLGGDGGKTNDK
jgi:cytochrome oxidase assembly protein ShyY1